MLILNFGVVAALWFGGVQVNSGTLQVGQVIAFINYLTQTLMALMMVSMLTMRLSRSEASAERIHEVLNNEPEVKTRPDALTEFAPQGRVVFEDVSFSYSGADHDPVLKNISFVAEPGQTVALLGATGAGKSSLIHLIPRFYDVSGGRVVIDGLTFAMSMSWRCAAASVSRCKSRCFSAARFATTSATAGPMPAMTR